MSAPKPSTAEQKAILRKQVLKRLSSLTESERAERSERLVRRLASLPQWAEARRVLLFAPVPTEPDLDLLWTSGCLTGKLCAYPKVTGLGLTLFEVTSPAELRSGRWGLREPQDRNQSPTPLREFDVILVPGLAFVASSGQRLGRGGGYYDRFLGSAAPGTLTIGVAFAFQLVDHLPVEPHDVAVDLVITDAA